MMQSLMRCTERRPNIRKKVLAKKKKKIIKKIEHYVGQVVEDSDNEITEARGDRMIKYLKREKNKGYKFIFYSDILYPLVDDDMVCKLPAPIQHGGTVRVSRHLIFPINLSGFENLL